MAKARKLKTPRWVQVAPGRQVLVYGTSEPSQRGKSRAGFRTASGRLSLSAGVDPTQVPAEIEFNKLHGVPATDYSPDGLPVFESLRHEAAYLSKRGLHNRDGVMG